MSHEQRLEEVNALEQRDRAARYADLVIEWVKSQNIAALQAFVTHSCVAAICDRLGRIIIHYFDSAHCSCDEDTYVSHSVHFLAVCALCLSGFIVICKTCDS